MGVLDPDLSGAMRTLMSTGGTTHDQGRNNEEGEGLLQSGRGYGSGEIGECLLLQAHGGLKAL